MSEIREIVRDNLVKLRKERKLTQLELSDKIGYSDKAISRWETGEVTPDVETLSRLAELYDVDISVFFKEYDPKVHKSRRFSELQLGKKIAVWSLLIIAIWYVGIMAFAYAKMLGAEGRHWMIFIWLIPLTFFICYLVNIKWGTRILGLIFTSLLIWTFLTAVYLQLLEYNLYLLFISGVPLQSIILLLSYIRTKKE